MGDTVEYDPANRRHYTRKTTSGEDVASAQDRAKMQSAEGLGKLEKKGKGPMPKQNPGESASSYAARLREWRASDHDTRVVGRAMEKLGNK